MPGLLSCKKRLSLHTPTGFSKLCFAHLLRCSATSCQVGQPEEPPNRCTYLRSGRARKRIILKFPSSALDIVCFKFIHVVRRQNCVFKGTRKILLINFCVLSDSQRHSKHSLNSTVRSYRVIRICSISGVFPKRGTSKEH